MARGPSTPISGALTEQACDLIVEAGQVSSDKRNEVILCQDVLGVESLVDMLDHKRAAEAANADPSKVTDEASSTYSAILGPFYVRRTEAQWISHILRSPVVLSTGCAFLFPVALADRP